MTIEQCHEAAHRWLLIARPRHRAPRGVDGFPHRSSTGQAIGGIGGGARRQPAKAAPFLLDPLPEVRRPRNVQSRQVVAAVERGDLRPVPCANGSLERLRVGAELEWIQPQFLVPPAQQGALSQGLSEVVDRLVERVSGVRFVELGPEQGKQEVPAKEGAGGERREPGEYGEALGLHQDGGNGPPVRHAEVYRPKDGKSDAV